MILFDITGKQLLENTLSSVTSNIDISSFSPGVYFIKVFTQEKILIRKFIKM
jgi:hypothetical protein